MKKLICILLACFMVFGLVACNSGTTPAPSAEPAQETEKTEPAPADEKLRLVFVINGTLGDKSFFDSGKEGLDWINRDFGDKVFTDYRELTYDSSTWEQKMADIVAEGWDIVVVGTYDMKDMTGRLATEYPDTKFWFFDEIWNFDGPDEEWDHQYDLPNVYSMMFAQNEGSFVVGAMAAMLTKTNKIAFMGGRPNTVLDDFYVGFANGAKYINPDVSVNCSWMNSFDDPIQGKTVATGLYQDGYDVVFACGGSAGNGGFDAVIEQDEGKYIIGVDGDQGSYFASLEGEENAAKAERTLTSMQKNVNYGFYQAMERHLNGTLPYGSNELLGLEGGYVSAVFNDATRALLTPEQIAQAEQIAADIISGQIDPGTAFNHDDAWFDSFVESMQ